MAGNESDLSLSDAVCLALAQEGVGLLERPEVLMGDLMDCMDLDSVELRTLMRCCDKELLSSYATCAGGGTEGLRVAVKKAQSHLEFTYAMKSSVAWKIADGIAAGVAAWCGMSWDDDRGASCACGNG